MKNQIIKKFNHIFNINWSARILLLLMVFSLVTSIVTMPIDEAMAYSNIISNGDMETWTSPSGPTPDSWSRDYGDINALRSTAQVKSGTYSAAVTGTSGSISQSRTGSWASNSFTFGMWVLDNVAGSIYFRARVRDTDTNTYYPPSTYATSSNSVNSPYWQFMYVTVSGVTAANVEEINFDFYCSASGSPIYMDGFHLSDTISFPFAHPPSVDSPSNIVYEKNDPTIRTISWTATDNDGNPNIYDITRDSVSVQSDSWTSGTPISINVEGLSQGTYNYQITVFDTDGQADSDSVTVTVSPLTLPTGESKNATWYYDNLTPEDRRKIRQAMDYAIPRDQIIEEVEGGFAVKAATIVSPHLTGIYDPTVQARDFNKNTSLDLLEEVFGYRYNATTEPYFSMRLNVPNTISERMEWAILVNESFNSIGIDATLEVWDWSTIMSRVFTDPLHPGWDYNHGGFDGFFVGFSGGKEYTFLEDYYSMNYFTPPGNNYIWLVNETLDDMITTSLENPDQGQRLQVMKDIQHWLHNNVPSSIIRKKLLLDAFDPNLEGFDPFLGAAGSLANWTISGQSSVKVALYYLSELNPILASTYQFSPVLDNTHMSLSRLRGEYNLSHPVPYLADSWTHSPDGLNWTVKLRQGVQWSDGSTLTADDVIFSYQAMLNESTGAYEQQQRLGEVLGNISAITKVSDYELNFTLPSFYPYVESVLFALPIVQKAEMSLIPFSDWWTHDTNQNRIPIGSGPYQFKSKYWSTYETLVLEANPYYNETLMGHDPNMVGGGNFVPNPSLDNVTFLVINNASTAVTELETGVVDVIDKLLDLKPYFDQINGSAWGKIVTSPEWGQQELGYNQYSPIWGMNPQDPRSLYRNLNVSLESELSLKPLKPLAVDVTVENQGFEDYTDVVVQLLVNDSVEDSKTITMIEQGSTEALHYQWIPTAEGIYNISVYIVPITDEVLIDDNYASQLVIVQNYIPMAPIIITSDFQLNSTFPGKGTFDDPVRIEGYGIAAANTSLISISNTTLYFNITDCLLNGTQSFTQGIYLTNVTNGFIFSNVIISSETGILLESSDNIYIYYNIIRDNSGYGIKINGSLNKNIMAFNVFRKNNGGAVQAKDDSSGTDGNKFIYNHWDDWTSPDNNFDGVVDKPYLLDGTTSNNDPYPLVSGDESTHLLVGMALLKPNSGDVLDGTVNIQWTPSIDTWEHEIDYSVYYSSDGGNNWNLILSDLSTTTLNWDTTTVDDGSSYKIKIVAVCDRGLTREIISPGMFSVDNVEDPTTTTTEPDLTTTTTISVTPGFEFVLFLLSFSVIIIYKKQKKK
ncbi:MAG: ABC transporter substrate-binding protein [Candidatus Hodarchaeales archaeon]|jgi:ABC-type transport system substrate-binding protein